MGFLFFYTAVLVAEKNLMRQKFIGLMEEIQSFFFGTNHKERCEAVDILIEAIRKSTGKTQAKIAAELTRLTGQNFGTDHAKWSAWWDENRVHFLISKRDADTAEKRDDHDSSN